MGNLVLRGASRETRVASDICVKSGLPTSDRVVLRGHAIPAWVNGLFIFSIAGMLFAGLMSGRRYRISVPFSHAVHQRWARLQRVAWIFGGIGAGLFVGGIVVGGPSTSLLFLSALALGAVGGIIGAVNTSENNVGVYLTSEGELALSRVHPLCVESVAVHRAEQP